MIGQQKLKDLCERWKIEPMPSLLVLVGDRGYGKNTAIEYIRKNVPNDGILRAEDNSVATVRAVIDKSYALGGNIFYVFTDCDNMSVQAKNALLKVMEEPPNGARFILTARNLNSLLTTIISRAFVYYMSDYSKSELEQFCNESKDEKISQLDITKYPFISCIGDVVRVAENKGLFDNMLAYADTLVEFIGDATQANVLKITTKLDLKDDDPSKYPLDLFLKSIRRGYCNKISGEKNINMFKIYFTCACIVERAICELKILSASKQNIIDTMLLNLRRAARGENL